ESLFLQAFFLLGFAQKTKRDGVAGFRCRSVLKAIDGRVEIAFFHIELANFEIFFRAQGIPHGLVGRVLRGGVFFLLGKGLRRRGASSVGWFRRRLRRRILRAHLLGGAKQSRRGQDWNGPAESHAGHGGLPIV